MNANIQKIKEIFTTTLKDEFDFKKWRYNGKAKNQKNF